MSKKTQYHVSPIFEEEPCADNYSPSKKKLDNKNTKVPYNSDTPSGRSMTYRYVNILTLVARNPQSQPRRQPEVPIAGIAPS